MRRRHRSHVSHGRPRLRMKMVVRRRRRRRCCHRSPSTRALRPSIQAQSSRKCRSKLHRKDIARQGSSPAMARKSRSTRSSRLDKLILIPRFRQKPRSILSNDHRGSRGRRCSSHHCLRRPVMWWVVCSGIRTRAAPRATQIVQLPHIVIRRRRNVSKVHGVCIVASRALWSLL